MSTIDLKLRPSLTALKLLFVLHLVPVGLLPFVLEPGQPMILLAGAFAVSWIWLRRHPVIGYGPRALARLVAHEQGHWTLYDGSGRPAEGELLADSYVHPRLLVLRFKLKDGSTRRRAILGDEASPESLRQLRARLTSENGE